MGKKNEVMTPEQVAWDTLREEGLQSYSYDEIRFSSPGFRALMATAIRKDRGQRAKLTGTINGFTEAEIALLEAALYGEFERSQTGTPEFLALFIKLRNQRTESIKKRIERAIKGAKL